MGIYDREYVRSGRGGGIPASPVRRFGAYSFNTWLIASNIAVFVIQALFLRPYASGRTDLIGDWIFQWGHFSTRLGFAWLEVWRLVSFQFLHADLLHLAFNMLGLFFFGPLVEQYLGRKRYAAYYLMCGLCGGLTYLLLNLVGFMGLPLPGALFVSPKTPLIGAPPGSSASSWPALHRPHNRRPTPLSPIPLKMRTFAYAYVAFVAANLFFFRGAQPGAATRPTSAAPLAGYFSSAGPIFFVISSMSSETPTSRAPPGPRVASRSTSGPTRSTASSRKSSAKASTASPTPRNARSDRRPKGVGADPTMTTHPDPTRSPATQPIAFRVESRSRLCGAHGRRRNPARFVPDARVHARRHPRHRQGHPPRPAPPSRRPSAS